MNHMTYGLDMWTRLAPVLFHPSTNLGSEIRGEITNPRHRSLSIPTGDGSEICIENNDIGFLPGKLCMVLINAVTITSEAAMSMSSKQTNVPARMA